MPFAVNMQSSYVMLRLSLSRSSSCFKYSSQHSVRCDTLYPKQSNTERVPLHCNITDCILSVFHCTAILQTVYWACSTALQYHRLYIERVPLHCNITHCILRHNLISPPRTCHCAWTNCRPNSQHKVCNKSVRPSWHEKSFSSYLSTSCTEYQNKTKKEWITDKIYIHRLVKAATYFD